MNKKGFTLTELLAVIIILGVLIGIGVTSYINIKNNSLEKQKENVISYLKTKAMNYADKTGITTVNVDTLIKEGYVDADDGSDIYDPVTKESMNCYIIESAYENGEYKESKVTEDKKENNVCKEYEITSELIEICKITAGGLCETLDKNWTNEDITLGVRYKTGNSFSAETTYEWQGTDGKSGKEKVIEVTTEEGTVNTSRYQVKIVDNDIHGVASKFIRIDKQAPGITKINVDKQNEWTQENKKVTIEATDYNGSGIDKYYISTNASCNEERSKEEKLANGTYYVCVSDNAGNKSDILKLEIIKIDTKPDKPVLNASDGVASKKAHTGAFSLLVNNDLNPYASTGRKAGETASNVHYEYYTSKNSTVQRVNENSIPVGIDVGNLIYYVRACNESNYCSDYSSYEAVTTFTITVNVTNGTSNPSSKTVVYNSSEKFTITPNFKYKLSGATVTCDKASKHFDASTGILTVSEVTSNTICSVILPIAYTCPSGSTLSDTTCTMSAYSQTNSSRCNCQTEATNCYNESYECGEKSCNCHNETESYSYECNCKNVSVACGSYDCSTTESYDCSTTSTYECGSNQRTCTWDPCATYSALFCTGSGLNRTCHEEGCKGANVCSTHYVSKTCTKTNSKTCTRTVPRTCTSYCSDTQCQTCTGSTSTRVCDTCPTYCKERVCDYETVCDTCYNTTYYCPSGWTSHESGSSMTCTKAATIG